MSAYYNEIEPYAVEWLRALETKELIARGKVDERSIKEVRAADLEGATQAHFFAGIGVWSRALRLAGIPDEFPVWTGSCPCQPFSAAGRGRGVDDERHLWPEWFRLINECRPAVVFGEQVASPDGLAWLDAVSTDLEGAGYSVGAADLCAAGVGAPHIRQRLYFVAFSDGFSGGLHLLEGEPRDAGAEARRSREARIVGYSDRPESARGAGECSEREGSAVDGNARRAVGDAGGVGSGRKSGSVSRAQARGAEEGNGDRDFAHVAGDAGGGVVDAERARLEGLAGHVDDGNESGRLGEESSGSVAEAGPTRGFWGNAEWLACRDGKVRAAEPGTFPLAHGATSRVGRLRAFGNAIVAPLAAQFIRAALEAKLGGLTT